ncbi:MAG: DNA gyrase inhibitor YacG [Deltaproteobacteria bacterium]|nr:DNA gyrase inhibitor YacG [Deltaproteobacteria bacterium]
MKVKCPYCKKESVKENNSFWPFCCERCKMIDLGKWAAGDYRIPGEPINREKEEGEKNGEDDVD